MEQKLRELIKHSMIEKNKTKQRTYKSILDNAQKTAKQTNSSVTTDMIIKAIKSEIKQLNDLKSYCNEDNNRLMEINEKLEYCEALLPKMATTEEMTEFLKIHNPEKNIGVCMKALKEHFGSLFDGKAAQESVKSYIAQ